MDFRRPRRSAPELGTGNEPRRDVSLYPEHAYMIIAFAVTLASICRLLRYRSYLATVRHIVDYHGLAGLPIIQSLSGASRVDVVGAPEAVDAADHGLSLSRLARATLGRK